MKNFIRVVAGGVWLAWCVSAQQPPAGWEGQKLQLATPKPLPKTAPRYAPPATAAAAPTKREFTDPWRVLNGETNHVEISLTGWQQFSGKIISVTKAGVLIENAEDFEHIWFIAGFPYEVADGEYISEDRRFAACPTGVFKYESVAGAAKTVRKMEYGLPINKPAWAVARDLEVSADAESAAKLARVSAKIANDERKSKADEASFKFHTDQAAAGNVGSMFRLGQLYLAGTGCKANTNQAKVWFQKAADAGNTEAIAALKSLE